jgi:uncharacterized protein (DUF952 family)
MPIIYHVTTAAEWKNAQQKGYYESASISTEGFIHCSQDYQVEAVSERYFKHKTGLIKLVIDTDRLTSRYGFDWSPSLADTFPHIYGPVNLDAVIEIIAL